MPLPQLREISVVELCVHPFYTPHMWRAYNVTVGGDEKTRGLDLPQQLRLAKGMWLGAVNEAARDENRLVFFGPSDSRLIFKDSRTLAEEILKLSPDEAHERELLYYARKRLGSRLIETVSFTPHDFLKALRERGFVLAPRVEVVSYGAFAPTGCVQGVLEDFERDLRRAFPGIAVASRIDAGKCVLAFGSKK